MVARRGVNRATLVEKIAAELDPELLNLAPALAKGVEGLREYMSQLTFLLQLNGGDEDDLGDLLTEIGVDTGQCYRVMLDRLR